MGKVKWDSAADQTVSSFFTLPLLFISIPLSEPNRSAYTGQLGWPLGLNCIWLGQPALESFILSCMTIQNAFEIELISSCLEIAIISYFQKFTCVWYFVYCSGSAATSPSHHMLMDHAQTWL